MMYDNVWLNVLKAMVSVTGVISIFNTNIRRTGLIKYSESELWDGKAYW